MIITPQNCTHFKEKNFKENLNKTCEIKGRCQLISDKASCSKYELKENESENGRRNQRQNNRVI